MVFNPLARRRGGPLPLRDKGVAGKRWRKGPAERSLFILPVVALLMLVAGCASPKVQTADPLILLKSDLLSFIQDGVTTREEALLKLGIPSAQMEKEKILMYQLRADQEGKWHLVAPLWNVTTGLRAWREGTCSLVLVFGGDGVLQKHSLVTAQ